MTRLAFIFSILLLFASCGTKTSTDKITSSQWKLFNYLPYNTEYIFYTNLSELKDSKFGIENFIPVVSKDTSNSWIKKFEEETGVGLRKGIEEILIANTIDNKSVFLVRFNENYNRVKNYFYKNPSFIKNEIENRETFSLKENPTTQIYFPEASVLLLTNEKSFLDSIILGKGKRLKENNNFISIIRNIKNKSIAWMATDKGAFAAGLFDRVAGKDSKLLSPEILSSIDNMSVSATFSNGVQIESSLGCSSAGDAYLLASAVQGAIAMNILSEKNVKLGKIFSKMDVKREVNLIRFHIELTKKELNDLKLLTKYTNQVNKF